MSSIERRQREQYERQERIMQTACALARAHGWHHVTLRGIASQLDYTHGMIYSYFESKEDLLKTIWCYGFDTLALNVYASTISAPTPIVKLHSFAQAYWQFAWEHFELYAIMFGLDGITFKVAQTDDIEGRKGVIQELANDTIKAVLVANNVQTSDLHNKIVLFWSSLHGLISFIMTTTSPEIPQDKHALVIYTVNNLLDAWHIPLPSISDLMQTTHIQTI